MAKVKKEPIDGVTQALSQALFFFLPVKLARGQVITARTGGKSLR